ncbi:hypothetical protein RFI_22152, partial [Reticulomyxa filosa]
VNVGYISMDWANSNPLYIYIAIGGGSVGVILLVFMLLFLWEVKTYGIYKYIQRDDQKARDHYFYSFVGTIIYGHGQFHSSNNKIMRLLCDTLFLVICDKLVMILCCTRDGKWRMDSDVTCWTGEHLKIGTVALIALAYYIPFCIMVAPMFVEFPTPLAGSCKDYLSLTSTVEFIKPYLSVVTLAKSFMLVSAQLLSEGKPVGTVLSQLFTCLALFIATVLWSWNNLNLQQYHKVFMPVFPYGVSILKSLGFLAGVIGSIIELLFVYQVLPGSMFGHKLSQDSADMQYLLLIFALACIFAALFFFKVKHTVKKNNQLSLQDKQILLTGFKLQNLVHASHNALYIVFDSVAGTWFWR